MLVTAQDSQSGQGLTSNCSHSRCEILVRPACCDETFTSLLVCLSVQLKQVLEIDEALRSQHLLRRQMLVERAKASVSSSLPSPPPPPPRLPSTRSKHRTCLSTPNRCSIAHSHVGPPVCSCVGEPPVLFNAPVWEMGSKHMQQTLVPTPMLTSSRR